MKHAKEFFGVLFGVLICVFLFGLVVYATTTVGNKVDVGAGLDVTGVASISGLATFDSGVSISQGDLSIEVGNFSVDGTVSISDSIIFDGITITAGTASPDSDCTTGDVYFRANAASDTIINVCETTNSWQGATITAD